jgi:hypothetical protein
MLTIRDKIIQIATAEATPQPYGKVSDLKTDLQGRRTGWESLKSYFDDTVQGWTQQKWEGRGEILVGGSWRKITYLDGVQIPNYRVPQPNKPSGVSWCGIFATWVLKKAGLTDAQWVVNKGIVSSKVRLVIQTTGFTVGDVVVFRGAEVHHSIVSEMPAYYCGDDTLQTINGNSGAQSIEMHRKYRAQNVAYYYKVID